MEPAGGVPWPARGGPGDGSSMRREIPSPAWEPPQKKVRNNTFHAPASMYSSQETVNYARGDGQGGFSPSLSHQPPVHAAGEQHREAFAPFNHGQGAPAYAGQQQMQSSNGYIQNTSQAPGRSFNIPPQSFNTPPQSSAPAPASAPGFPPGSAKGTGVLFLKTKLCTKFKLGTCTFNERCHFAHGMEDLRKPPVGWETMVANAGQGGPFPDRTGDGNLQQQRKKSSKPCRFFADGKECPYGDRCTFVHVAGDDLHPASGFGGPDGGGLPAPRLKTRLCARWERGEACNYGERCHYAHGYAELQSDNGMPAHSNNNAPASNKVQYSNSSLETAPFMPQFSAPKAMNAPPAVAPPGGPYFMANPNAASNAYPGPGVQQPGNNFTRNQGGWNGTPAEGGFLENQTVGSWASQPMADGGYSKDPAGSGQYIPAQVQQPPLGQSYATGSAGIYQAPVGALQYLPPQVQQQSLNGNHQDPNQSGRVPYGHDGGNANFPTEALGGNGAYYPATYFPNHPT